MDSNFLESYFYDQIENLDVVSSQGEITFGFGIYHEQDLYLSVPIFEAVKRRFGGIPESGVHHRVRLVINGNFNSVVLNTYPCEIRFENAHVIPQADGSNFRPAVQGNRLAFTEDRIPNVPPLKIDLSGSYIRKINVKCDAESINGFSFFSDEIEIGPFSFFESRCNVRHIDFSSATVSSLKIYNTSLNDIRISEYPARQLNGTIFNTSKKTCKLNNVITGTLDYEVTNDTDIDIREGIFESININVVAELASVLIGDLASKRININSRFPNCQIGIVRITRIDQLDRVVIKSLMGNKDVGSSSCLKKLRLENLTLGKDFIGEVKNFHSIQSIVFLDIVNKGELYFRNLSFSQQTRISIAHHINRLILGEDMLALELDEELQKDGLYFFAARIGNLSFINSNLPATVIVHEVELAAVKFINTKPPTKIRGVRLHNKIENELSALQQFKKSFDAIRDKETSTLYRSKELDFLFLMMSSQSHILCSN